MIEKTFIKYSKFQADQLLDDFNRSNDAANKTKLTGLDLDCLFLILKNFDLTELLSVAQVHRKLSMAAADVFHYKYSRLRIVVRDDFSIPEKSNKLLDVASNSIGRVFQRFGIIKNKNIPKPEENAIKIDVTDTAIRLDEYAAVVNTFKHFGCVMKKLKFTTSLVFRHSKEKFLGNLISENKFNSLDEIWFYDSTDQLLTGITKPLSNVETVRFERLHLDVVPNGLPLNEQFPAVHRMELNSLTGSGLGYFACHMPQLIHVSIKGIDLNNFQSVIDIITTNSQIQSIELYDDEPNFVQKVNELLPQLETLTISTLKLSDGSIRFENVITFAINHDFGSPINLYFPRLQNLYIEYTSKRFENWINFLNEHNHLNHLHLRHWDLIDSQFQQLIANLTHLVELTLEFKRVAHPSQALSINVIVEFLSNHDNVQKLNVVDFYKQDEIKLKKQLINEWKVEGFRGKLSFARKTSNLTHFN